MYRMDVTLNITIQSQVPFSELENSIIASTSAAVDRELETIAQVDGILYSISEDVDDTEAEDRF